MRQDYICAIFRVYASFSKLKLSKSRLPLLLIMMLLDTVITTSLSIFG